MCSLPLLRSSFVFSRRSTFEGIHAKKPPSPPGRRFYFSSMFLFFFFDAFETDIHTRDKRERGAFAESSQCDFISPHCMCVCVYLYNAAPRCSLAWWTGFCCTRFLVLPETHFVNAKRRYINSQSPPSLPGETTPGALCHRFSPRQKQKLREQRVTCKAGPSALSLVPSEEPSYKSMIESKCQSGRTDVKCN